MDYEAARRFEAFLASRDSVRWVGRPQQGIFFRASDALMIPFSVLWCGFAIFWESSVVLSNAPFFFRLWGIPFVLVGLYMVVGRFFYDAYVRSNTYYALTDRSALILSGFNGDKLTTVDLKTLQELHLRVGGNGRGTIIFGPDAGFVGGFGRRSNLASPEFSGIDNVKDVYAQVQRQREG